MSFGSPTPVEIAVSGPNFADNRALRREDSRRAGQDPVAARPAVRPVARLPDGRGQRRPREGRPGGPDAGRRLAVAGHGHVVAAGSSCPTTGPTPRAASPTRCRSRFRGPWSATPDGVQTDRLGGGPGTDPAEADRRRPGPAARRRRGQARHDAGPVRPLQHEAAGHADGQHRRRRPGHVAGAGARGRQAGRRSAQRGEGRPPRPDPADERDAERPVGRPGRGRRRRVPAADGELPVGAAGAGRRLDRAGRARRRAADAVAHRHDAQHPVVHRRDHGHRRGDGQRDPAGDLRREASAARAQPPARPPSTAPAAACGRS